MSPRCQGPSHRQKIVRIHRREVSDHNGIDEGLHRVEAAALEKAAAASEVNGLVGRLGGLADSRNRLRARPEREMTSMKSMTRSLITKGRDEPYG